MMNCVPYELILIVYLHNNIDMSISSKSWQKFLFKLNGFVWLPETRLDSVIRLWTAYYLVLKVLLETQSVLVLILILSKPSLSF